MGERLLSCIQLGSQLMEFEKNEKYLIQHKEKKYIRNVIYLKNESMQLWKITKKKHLSPKKVPFDFNYWMRLSMISWIIKTEVCVICGSRRLRQITQTRGFDNSWYHAKTEFNNCFIIYFSHNSSSETEAKRSAILFLRRTLQRGLVTRQTLNLTW